MGHSINITQIHSLISDIKVAQFHISNDHFTIVLFHGQRTSFFFGGGGNAAHFGQKGTMAQILESGLTFILDLEVLIVYMQRSVLYKPNLIHCSCSLKGF